MDSKLTSVNLAKGQLETDVYKVAVASSDGIVVNQHFGRADTFFIYEVAGTGDYRFLETRTVMPVCNGGNHNEERLSGIVPMELPGMIEESLGKLITYEQLQHLF